MDFDDFESLEAIIRPYNDDSKVLGRFDYFESSVIAGRSKDSGFIALGTEENAIEALDTVNMYFPLRGDLSVCYAGDEAARGLDLHMYQSYEHNNWKKLDADTEFFGFQWGCDSGEFFGKEGNYMALYSKEDRGVDREFMEGVREVAPEFNEVLDDRAIADISSFLSTPPNLICRGSYF